MRLFFAAASTLCACLLMAPIGVAFALSPEQALIEEAKRMDSVAGTARESQLIATIINEFKAFAGSQSNASNLLSGLRQGRAIALTKPDCAGISFTPAIGRIDYGDAFIALSLARQNLLKQGISHPCPEQIMAALVGDQGVLKLRSQGWGWAQVAQVTGAPLGGVIDSVNSLNTDLDRWGAIYGQEHPINRPTTQVGGASGRPGAGHPELPSQTEDLTGRPDVSRAGIPRPGGIRPEIGGIRPETTRLDAKPDRPIGIGVGGIERPTIIRPDRPPIPDKPIRPEVIRPEMVRPELVRPEMVRPEIIRPEVLRPEVRPEVLRPELRPGIVRPSEVRPEVLQREIRR